MLPGEVVSHMKLDHPYVIACKQAFTTPAMLATDRAARDVHVVMELADIGDLHNYIDKVRS